jgi:hypothetical protein
MNYSKTFTITSETYYDPFIQQYSNILVVNIEPQGPLRRFVTRLNNTRLSPFNRNNYMNNQTNQYNCCRLALLKVGINECSLNRSTQYSKCGSPLMTPDEIPDLISWLLGNGYQIETQITNMLNQSELKINNQRLAFTATYYGTNQPNIFYSR